MSATTTAAAVRPVKIAGVPRDAFPDVVLRATCADGETVEVRAHRVVLAASPYFACLWARARPAEIVRRDGDVAAGAATAYWGVYALEVPFNAPALRYAVDTLYGARGDPDDVPDRGDLLRACLFLALPERRYLKRLLRRALAADTSSSLLALLVALIDSEVGRGVRESVLARTVGLLDDGDLRSMRLEERDMAPTNPYRPKPAVLPGGDGLMIGGTVYDYSYGPKTKLLHDDLEYYAYAFFDDDEHVCRFYLGAVRASAQVRVRRARVTLALYDPLDRVRRFRLRDSPACYELNSDDSDDDRHDGGGGGDDAAVLVFPPDAREVKRRSQLSTDGAYRHYLSVRPTGDLTAYQFRVRFVDE